MSKKFRRMQGDWTQQRRELRLSKDNEVDLHFGKRDIGTTYRAAMDESMGSWKEVFSGHNRTAGPT